MRNSTVIPFTRVSAKHLFFREGKIRDFEIAPIGKTQALMKKMGVFLKNEGAAITVGFSEKTLGFFDDDEQKIMLTFELKGTNPYFQSYTDLPIYAPQKKLFYFDNLKKEASADGITLMHNSPFVSERNLANVGSSKLEVKLKEKSDSILIINELEDEIVTFKNSEDEKKERVLFDLTEESPNLFTLKEGEETNSFYAFPSSLSHAFGMLHLYLDKAMLETQKGEQGIKWQYEIKFNNRATYWRYYFLNSKIKENPTFTISHPMKEVAFSKPEMKQLSNGQEAWMVVSENPIEIKEVYEQNFSVSFKLEKDSRRAETIALPNANIEGTRGTEEEGVIKMYSDMYIYI